MIKVSIIMPSYNVADYIEECLISALSQTLSDTEIICIDANSTDGTDCIIEKMSHLDKRIVLVRSDVRSYGYQVNRGIEMAKGEYIAILETDDYVDASMYEVLYNIAREYELDYIKADYKRFFSLNSGERIYTPYRQFISRKDMYGKAINPHECDHVYIADHNLWRGIYKRFFIQKNNIKLLETAGAAYQDIGFLEEVFLYAESAMYVDDCLYYYRTDREDASVNSVKGLYNTWHEFRLFYNNYASSKRFYKRGVILHMALSFLGEYKKVLSKVDFNPDAPECGEYVSWFFTIIDEAIRKNVITEYDFEENVFLQLKSAIRTPEIFSEKLKAEYEKTQKKKRELAEKVDEKIVIFGAGFQGYNTLKELDKKGCRTILAFADNDIEKQGTMIAGLPVYSLEHCLNEFSGAFYIIANERHTKSMKEQFIKAGGNEGQLAELF